MRQSSRWPLVHYRSAPGGGALGGGFYAQEEDREVNNGVG